MSIENLQHWKVTVDENAIAWWWLDRVGTSANTLHSDVLNEMEQLIDRVPQQPQWRGVIIASAKKNGFIAGADINQFRAFQTTEEAAAYLNHAQKIFNKLEALTIPTVAMVDGFCLGGGYELALSCRYIVAEESRKTKIGLPEILLGIFPGWGGTVRLPERVGAMQALPLLLQGKMVDGTTAYKSGMVDAAVPRRHLARAARYFIQEQPKRRPLPWWKKAISAKPIRPLFGYILRKQVAQHARPEHYPAPYAVIDKWVHESHNRQEAFQEEIHTITRLVIGEAARNLIRVFFLREQLKGLARGSNFQARHVHVIGAGVMGGDIAAWCSLRGLKVTLQDREAKYIAPAIGRACDLFKGVLKRPRLVQEAMDRLQPDIEGYGVAHADVIIEAIYENVAAKQELFVKVEKIAKADAILASNTSSIPLAEIGKNMQNPQRLVGIHYFNPVAKLPLVEVVHDVQTDAQVVQQAMAFVKQIDKLPLPVTSTPGFLVNRVLIPYMMEAMELFQEGVAKETIDKAARRFGMPMGPIELADSIGLDICMSVIQHMHGNAATGISTLQTMIQEGKLGRKNGKGFYTYIKGKAQKAKKFPEPEAVVTDRLMLRLLNEAMACLREKVVNNSNELDAGIIFGLGFAPFRGGPLHYAQQQGYATIQSRLQDLQHQYGERFQPDAGWNHVITSD